MKAATGIGIGLAMGGILLGAIMEGTSPAALINIPAIIIIFAGTAGATMAAVGMDRMKAVPGLYKRVLNAEPPAAVVAGNVETSSRVADLVLGAFGRALGQSPQYWLNLQAAYDLKLAEKAMRSRLRAVAELAPA